MTLRDSTDRTFIEQISAFSKESIVVEAQSFPFPIELARLDGQFLATRHLVVRQFPESDVSTVPNESHPLQRFLYVSDPSRTLPYESVEAVFFSELLTPSYDLKIQAPSRMTVREFRECLSSSEFDVVHFTGHGRFDRISRQSRLVFSDGELLASDIMSMTVKRPPRLVVLNACSTVKDTSLAQSEDGTVSSITKALLLKGCDTVIGTLWPIADCSAAKFSTAFYRYMFDCQVSAKTALFLTKRRYLADESTIDIAGYVLYSLPGAHVVTLRKAWAIS